MSDAAALVAEAGARLAPLERAVMLAEWELATTSTDEAEQRAQSANIAWVEAIADPGFLELVERAAAAPTSDPLVRRQVEILRLATEGARRPPDLQRRMVELESTLVVAFSRHRGRIGERELSQNDIDAILEQSTDSEERRAAWEAQKSIGPLVADGLRELIRVRNEAARAIGYRDHYAFALATSEVPEEFLFAFLDDLDRLLDAPWREEIASFTAAQATRLGLAPGTRLAPWDYIDCFAQDPIPTTDDPLFAAAAAIDLEAACTAYYGDLGCDVGPVMARSDLYPRAGKSQHAFQVTIDRGDDIRMMNNLEPSLRWLETLLHELGHAVYDAEVDRSLPWLLRTHAHILTTEAMAMLQGRRARDAVFLERYAGVAAEVAGHPANAAAARRGLLVFNAWVQVMVRFERALYADPDADLGALWWKLVERYQGIEPPPGPRPYDWATKIHLALSPVYYHNYLLGQTMALQLEAAIARALGTTSPVADPEGTGRLVRERVHRPGARVAWDELVREATGEPLSAAAYAAACHAR